MTLPCFRPPPPGDLPPQQARVLAFIVATLGKRGRFPTGREIANHMGWRGEQSAYDCMCRLEWRGKLRCRAIADSTIARTRAERTVWELA